MVRLTKLVLACIVLLCVTSSGVAQEAHETWGIPAEEAFKRLRKKHKIPHKA